MSGPAPAPGAQVPPGGPHYRAFVGAAETYDLFAHLQFSLLTLLGLRQHHRLLDVGCGSLRAGKLFIVYLLEDRYCGIEPEAWLVEQGLARELGADLVARKRPRFVHARDFPCDAFGTGFDFVLAQSILSHAAPAQVRQCLQRVAGVLEPTGVFVASYVAGEVDHDGEAWVYPSCVRYRPATIAGWAEAAGLVAHPVEWFHAGGQQWVAFTHPGHAPDLAPLAAANTVAPMRLEVGYYRRRQERLEWLLDQPWWGALMAVRRTLARLRGR